MLTLKRVPEEAALTIVLVLLLAVASGSASPQDQTRAAVDGHSAGGVSPVASRLGGTPTAATPVSGGGVHLVHIAADDYEPGGLRVRVGDTVHWVNLDGVTHTVSANDDSFDSGPMHRGGVYSHTFLDPGSYRYSCDLHLEMSGAVVVTGG